MIPRIRFPTLAALALCVSLVLLTTACPSGRTPQERERQRQRLEEAGRYGQQLSALLAANASLPDQLAEQGAVSAETAARVRTLLAEARPLVDEFNGGAAALLAAGSVNAVTLVPVVVRMIDKARQIEALLSNQIYQRVMAGIAVALRVIANYFAVTRAELNRRGVTDEQIGREVARLTRTRYDPRAVSVIVSYANQRAAYEPST